MTTLLTQLRTTATVAGLAVTLGACDVLDDWDLRDLGGNTLDTSQAVRDLPDRPRPDDRGVISYPNYQVVVARRGDTVRSIADRLGISARELARYNGLDPDTELRRDEVLALPTRVSEPSPETGAIGTGPILPPDPEITATTLAPAAIATAPQTGEEPIRHQVQSGETVFSIARTYGVDIRTLAEWNGLGPDLLVREGQYLLIPQGGQPTATAVTTAPGSGSPTPTPPSASAPLPIDGASSAPAAAATVEAPTTPSLGSGTAQSGGSFVYPVQGTIIREYAPGKNEGIDIGAPAGTPVKAASAGTVAVVTQDTNGVPIVVIRHDGDLLTVYTNLDSVTVSKGDTVKKGQTIGKVRAGSPSYLHFEVRRGVNSVDPADYL